MSSKIARHALTFLVLMEPVFFCKSATVKDTENLEKIHEQAKKGDKKSYENYEKALDKAKEENNPELQELIIKDLASIPTNESREILKKEAESETPQTRDSAISGLYEQSKVAEKSTSETIKNETLQIIKNNAENYDELTQKEIQILGEIKSEESEDLLIETLNRQPPGGEQEKTEIVKSLALILSARQKEINDLDASANPDPEKKSILEASSENIKKALIGVLNSDAPRSLKETAILELYNAYVPNSRKKFIEMYGSPDYDENVKLMILEVLGYRENPENNEIVKSLKSEYLKTENPKEHARILNRIHALVPNDFKLIKAQLEKEFDNIMRRKEFKALAAKGQLFMLKAVFKKHHLPENIVEKIQAATQELANDNTTPMSAPAVILFSGVREIYPDKNYFEIKKAAERGLNIPGLFYVILSFIDKEYASYDMKILTIRTVWKIEDVEAAKIYKAYDAEKYLLKELLR